MNNPIMFGDNEMLDYFNTQPSAVKGRVNSTTDYYKRMLYTKIYSTLKFTIPKSWNLNYFRFWLFHYGSIGVIYTDKFGWVAQPYSVVKLNLYYNPQVIQVYNSFITEPKIGVIGKNAGIVHLMDDYFGLDDVVTRYAEMLAQCDRSINVNLMNSNVTVMFEADSKKQADEVKTMYQQATEGKPFVAINKDTLDGKKLTSMINNVGSNYICDKVQTTKRNIVNEFLTEIGIRNANYDKKERLNSQEVSENDDETKAILSVIFDNITKCFEEINAISDLGLKVEYAYDYGKEVNIDE